MSIIDLLALLIQVLGQCRQWKVIPTDLVPVKLLLCFGSVSFEFPVMSEKDSCTNL